ncbi:MAG: SPASM domain-containing protein, partial [Candidatus Hodarchaeales archaeon]
NGEIRPCFIRVTESDIIMGNILNPSINTISLNKMYIAARKMKYCDPFGCRQCHLNFLLESGVNGSIFPSNSPEVTNDPFF